MGPSAASRPASVTPTAHGEHGAGYAQLAALDVRAYPA